jgi:ATP-dependent Clp endopeptidase proteolytic subunit ClpP
MDKIFFNMSAAGDTATIWLYGDIGDNYGEKVSSEAISRELKEAEASYGNINVRINSMGGEVYAGIAIFSAIRNSKANVRIYVDGIAASMASVIALCGKPVEMSRYARLMLHSISGSCWGRVQDFRQAIAEMDSLESTLCDMLAGKTGKTAADIKADYFDGADHYLTAAEALELGFIDGIYDATPPPESIEIEKVYQSINNRLKKPQNSNQMNIDDLRKRPLFKDCVTDEDALRVVAELEVQAGQVTDMAARLKVFEDKAKADAEAAKKSLLDAAEADGRINAQTRPIYEALLNTDMVNGQAAIEALPKKKRAAEYIDSGSKGESAWEKKMQGIRKKINFNFSTRQWQ